MENEVYDYRQLFFTQVQRVLESRSGPYDTPFYSSMMALVLLLPPDHAMEYYEKVQLLVNNGDTAQLDQVFMELMKQYYWKGAIP